MSDHHFGPTQTIVLDGVQFERTPGGNEVARRGSTIVGLIIANAGIKIGDHVVGGDGGRVTFFDENGRGLPRCQHVRNRAEARAMIVSKSVVA